MKTVFVCLAIALLFGVSFGWDNYTNPYTCYQARTNITRAEAEIESQHSRIYTDTKLIARLEADIVQYRNIANFTCTPEEVCYDARMGIVKAKEAIEREKRSIYTDAKVIEKLNQLIAFFKDQIFAKCSGAEVCANAQYEIKVAREEIAKEKRSIYTDAKVIAKLEAGIYQSKQVIAWRCPYNDSCAFGQAEINFAREEITKEKRSIYTDAKVVAKLESDVANSTDLVLNTCAPIQACNFIAGEIKYAEEAINSENRSIYTDRTQIAKLEAIIRRMNEARFYRCGNNGFMRLAEGVARRGGRILARWLRQ